MQQQPTVDVPRHAQFFRIRQTTDAGRKGFRAFWVNELKIDTAESESPVLTVPFRETREAVRNSMAFLFGDVQEWGKYDEQG